MTTTDVWLTRDEAAARFKLSPKTLAQWASMNSGPVFHKFGGHCRDRLSDVIAWENAQTVRGDVQGMSAAADHQAAAAIGAGA
jgi:hypothetical protein